MNENYCTYDRSCRCFFLPQETGKLHGCCRINITPALENLKKNLITATASSSSQVVILSALIIATVDDYWLLQNLNNASKHKGAISRVNLLAKYK